MKSIPFLLTLLMVARVEADAPVPFERFYRDSDTIVIGSLQSMKRISDYSIRSKTAPKEPYNNDPQYQCELTIEVISVLKAKDPNVKEGTTQRIIWYKSNFAPCSLDRMTAATYPGLWLLRTENGILRSVVDRELSFRALSAFTPGIKEEMQKWKDPALEIIYLFVKPGARMPESDYGGDVPGHDVIWFAGLANYLKVYRAVYLESSYMRNQMNIDLYLNLGMCRNSARKALAAEGQLDNLIRQRRSLNPSNDRAEEEYQLSQIRSLSKEKGRAKYGGTKIATDLLTQWACASRPRAKALARQVLHDTFGVDPSTLSCIPCE